MENKYLKNVRKLTFENRHDKIAFIIFSLCHCCVHMLSKIFQNIHGLDDLNQLKTWHIYSWFKLE